MTRFMKSRRRGSRRPGGFTLLELMITLAVAAIALALAIPTFDDINQKRQTTSQAEELSAFLSHAMSEAVKSNQSVSVSLVHNSSTDWCIGAHEGAAACDCEQTDTTAADYCSIEGVADMMDSSAHPKAQMVSHSADTTFAFDPIRGILETADLGSDHNFKLQSDNGNYALQVEVGNTGRIKVCNPDSSRKVPGFDSCT